MRVLRMQPVTGIGRWVARLQVRVGTVLPGTFAVSVAPSYWPARLVFPFLRARLTIDESSIRVRMVSRIGRRVVLGGAVARSKVDEVECGNSLYKSYLNVRGVTGPLPGVGAIWVDDAAAVRSALDSQGWPVALGVSWEHAPSWRWRR